MNWKTRYVSYNKDIFLSNFFVIKILRHKFQISIQFSLFLEQF